jgi:signal peptidase I
LGSRTGFVDGRAEGLAPPPKSAIRDYVEVILVCVIVLVFLRTFVVQQSEIPSGSMEDTLLVGDYILVNRFLYAPTALALERGLLPTRDVRRGEVIVFKNPITPELDFIKRVIGLPGETVELRRGVVHIDGIPLHEPYVNGLYRTAKSFAPTRVPEGQYFVLGDHRNHSSDSRVWGMVPRHLIKGRAYLILLSTSAPQPAGEPPGTVSLRSLARKFFNLIFNARWDRALRPIR